MLRVIPRSVAGSILKMNKATAGMHEDERVHACAHVSPQDALLPTAVKQTSKRVLLKICGVI